jgi:hypothetical protein
MSMKVKILCFYFFVATSVAIIIFVPSIKGNVKGFSFIGAILIAYFISTKIKCPHCGTGVFEPKSVGGWYYPSTISLKKCKHCSTEY